MRLIDDWRRTVKRAWSVRLALLSGALSAIEFALPFMAPTVPSRRFAAAAAAVALAAAIARVVAQPKLHDDQA